MLESNLESKFQIFIFNGRSSFDNISHSFGKVNFLLLP